MMEVSNQSIFRESMIFAMLQPLDLELLSHLWQDLIEGRWNTEPPWPRLTFVIVALSNYAKNSGKNSKYPNSRSNKETSSSLIEPGGLG